MPFTLDQYQYLKRIIKDTYQNKIVYKNSINGAHDINWAKEYKLFYNTQPNSTPFVKRIFFKVNEPRGKGVGFSNIRPVTDASEVSETYLTPPKDLSPPRAYVKCLTERSEYGEEVECVPYIMPESIFGMCIHASVWICLKILEQKDNIEKSLSIPEIQTLAGGQPYTDKQGLLFVQSARILRMCKTNAIYIINKEEPVLSDNQMLMELYAYVESGIPVIIGVDVADLKWWNTTSHEYHSIVAIGHTMIKNEVNGFIFHDESALPYQVMTKNEILKAWHTPHRHGRRTEGNHIRELLVAVPPEVSLPFHNAYRQFEETLSALRYREIISEDAESLRIRPMLTRPIMLFYQTKNPLVLFAIREAMDEASAPEFVWVIYFFDEDTKRDQLEKAKGFFVRDATLQTDFRFIFSREQKTAVYQLTEKKTYQRFVDRKRRKRKIEPIARKH